MKPLLVLTNLPDRETADRIARSLIEKRLAACVNILAPCVSHYRWKDRVQKEEEHPMLIKTTEARYAELEAAIKIAHPYEIPEIIAVPIERGLPGYLSWIGEETNKDAAP